jgi:hypothetical protein
MIPKPTFSVTHTTARPAAWRASYAAWISRAVCPAAVEYVLCCDERWGFFRPSPDEGNELDTWQHERASFGLYRTAPLNHLVWNTGRRCMVDGANIAAAAATGHIIIVNSDDIFPPERWDELVLAALAEKGIDSAAGEFVVYVSSGTPADVSGLMVLQVLSRERYERLGYALYPEYESMYCDNDFSEAARHDGVVVDCSDLVFYHNHPAYNGVLHEGARLDEVYQHENRGPAYDLGRAILERRRALGFSSRAALPAALAGAADGRTIALCIAGENFRGEWLDAFATLYTHLLAVRGFNVLRLRNYTTNVYATRLEVWAALRSLETTPDFVLWLDDDNLATPEQFDLLLSDLEADGSYQVMAAWSWVHDREQSRFQVSAGNWSADSAHWVPFDSVDFPELAEVQPAEVIGFPCVLMRGAVVGAVCERPFIEGILDNRLPYGIGGEDLAFCRACRGVCRIGVDPRVRVKHLKWMEVIPEFTRRPVDVGTVAVMIPACNEGRWIRRVVQSVRELGTVVVLNDHSTDDTRAEAEAAGAVVIDSPFPKNSPADRDEIRDKNWLLGQVKALCDPRWVLCIDGDEELERGGVAKIWRACASHVAEIFQMRILYLWDSPFRVRFDGSYSKFWRNSLFRVLSGHEFQSLYTRAGHAGMNPKLHTGNAPLPPAGVSHRGAALNVNLLHYGYMLKADRIRKYAYYNEIDPQNPHLEDSYRHLVQGDVPEVPADAKLLHGGPLDVRDLPASLVPDWQGEVVPL